MKPAIKMFFRLFPQVPAAVLASAAMLLLVGCRIDTARHVRSELIMGTFVEITVVPGALRGDALDAAIDDAFKEVERIDGLMSTYKPDSEVSQINRLSSGKPLQVSEDTFRVIELALEFNSLTQGAFDITVGPLVALWGFGSEGGDEHRVPTRAQIDETLGHAGSNHIELDRDGGRTVTLGTDGMHIDLSGIAKGYAVDRAAAVLRDVGVTHALVNAGGDIAAVGGKTAKNPWTVGVQRPVQGGTVRDVHIIGKLPLFDGAVATSGNYEDYFTIGGQTYSHIIDPRSGIPREHVPSITVIATDCTTADALATGLLVLGPEQGLRVVESVPGVEALILSDKDGELTVTRSSGWTAKIDLSGT